MTLPKVRIGTLMLVVVVAGLMMALVIQGLLLRDYARRLAAVEADYRPRLTALEDQNKRLRRNISAANGEILGLRNQQTAMSNASRRADLRQPLSQARPR